MITIDGSLGEGGGQILRTSLSLSLITGTPFWIVNIRAKRKKPGLMRQHLAAVKAAAIIGSAEVEGDNIESMEISFKPGKVRPGKYDFRIGSAGSATLVFQTLLPALMIASEESQLSFEGGTHNPFAPPWDFLVKTFLPQINKMGPTVNTELVCPGFYPAGGGKFTASIKPSELTGLELMERGQILDKRVRALVSKIPLNVAKRELNTAGNILDISNDNLVAQGIVNACGPGNVVFVEIESENITEVFTGFGERGIPAEMVSRKVAQEVQGYLSANVPVDYHLADQLMVPLAIAGKGSYKTLPLTEHSRTNLKVIEKFCGCNVCIRELKDTCLVSFG